MKGNEPAKPISEIGEDTESMSTESLWDENGAFHGPSPTISMLREDLNHLCMYMEYLRSWWEAHQEFLRRIPGVYAYRVHDFFIEGALSSRSIARAAGFTIDRDSISAYRWAKTPEEELPLPPEVGPPPPFTWLGDNLGLSSRQTFVRIRTPDGDFNTSLSEALRNIDLFSDPGRTRVLWLLPFLFDMPAAQQ